MKELDLMVAEEVSKLVWQDSQRDKDMDAEREEVVHTVMR